MEGHWDIDGGLKGLGPGPERSIDFNWESRGFENSTKTSPKKNYIYRNQEGFLYTWF